MPFTDPIVAGATLVRDAIQSEDYQPGVSGWIIRRDGSAEFNVGTYRGAVVINGADGLPAVTIDEDGMLIKDNTSGSAVQIAPTQPEGATIRLTPANDPGFTWLPGKLFSSNGIYPGPISNPRGYTSLISSVESGRKTSAVVLYGEGTQPGEECTALLSADKIEIGGKTRAGNMNVAGTLTVAGKNIDTGVWLDWTPQWYGLTTNPNLGTNPVIAARYTYLNKHTVLACWQISPGAGAVKGSGIWEFSLPVGNRTPGIAVGDSVYFDAGVKMNTGAVHFSGTTFGRVRCVMQGLSAEMRAEDATGTFSSSYIQLNVMYEV